MEVRQQVGGLRDDWDRLVDAGTPASPFLKSWWVDNASSGVPVIIAVRAGEDLVGGAAFELDTLGPARTGVQRIRCVGQQNLAPDHIDVVAAPSERSRVVAAVARWIRDGDRVVDLDGLSASCELPWLFDARVIATDPAPYLTLDGPDPLATLPGRLRSTIKRSGRRLEKQGWRIERVDNIDGADDHDADRSARAVADLLRLHDSRWRDRSALGSVRDPLSCALEAALALGDAVIHQLTDGATVIASELELLAGRRACFYQAGRLTDREYRGSGSVLKAAALRWAAEAGFEEFDLLRGADPYKDDWASGSRRLRRVRTGFGPRGAPAAAAMNLWKTASPAVHAATAALRGSGTPELVDDVQEDRSR